MNRRRTRGIVAARRTFGRDAAARCLRGTEGVATMRVTGSRAAVGARRSGRLVEQFAAAIALPEWRRRRYLTALGTRDPAGCAELETLLLAAGAAGSFLATGGPVGAAGAS